MTDLNPGDLVRVISPGCPCDDCRRHQSSDERAARLLEGAVARITAVTPTHFVGINVYQLSGLTVAFYGDEIELVEACPVQTSSGRRHQRRRSGA